MAIECCRVVVRFVIVTCATICAELIANVVPYMIAAVMLGHWMAGIVVMSVADHANTVTRTIITRACPGMGREDNWSTHQTRRDHDLAMDDGQVTAAVAGVALCTPHVKLLLQSAKILVGVCANCLNIAATTEGIACACPKACRPVVVVAVLAEGGQCCHIAAG